MNAIHLSLTNQQDPYQATLVVSGEVDIVNACRIEPNDVLRGLASGATVHIDLTGVTFIDSTGITRLLSLKREAEGRGIRTACYVRDGGIVQRVMRLIRVTDVLAVIPVSSDAQEGLPKPGEPDH